MAMNARLDALLLHPLLWRAQESSHKDVTADVLPTGFAQLDSWLPGGGWPSHGLIEILGEQVDGALHLLSPVLAKLFSAAASQETQRALAWIAPPFEPYPPALVACGIDINSILVIRTEQILWAMEQSLRSAVCRIVLGWMSDTQPKSLRRLQLAAEEANSLSIVIRPLRYGIEPSPAVLRLTLEREVDQLKVNIIKSRGGRQGAVLIPWFSMIEQGERHAAE
jgi:cell division inhibitor SulA/protein ImuA